MKKKVMFLCTGNSCRSQMAEGFLKAKAGGAFEVFSAGTRPAGKNPLAVQVMDEIGIDISKQASENVKNFSGEKFDYVITVCDNAKANCPVFPGEYKREHWNLIDPAEAEGTAQEKLVVFRKIRDQIDEKVKEFILSLGK